MKRSHDIWYLVKNLSRMRLQWAHTTAYKRDKEAEWQKSCPYEPIQTDFSRRLHTTILDMAGLCYKYHIIAG